jgi:hypothetical protein
MADDRTRCWGSFRIAEGTAARFQIGPLTLLVRRLRGEWRVARAHDRNPLDPRLEIDLAASDDDEPPSGEVSRFASSGGSHELRLTPLLADRPVVSRPEHPFCLPVDESTTLYVSTPMWMRLEEAADGRLLQEFPVSRPSDTWFGPNPRVGELCYATRTLARLGLADVVYYPYRAVTAVHIENRSRAPLWVERIKLPVPYLSLYRTAVGLWTQDVTFEHLEDEALAPVRLREVAPSAARAATRVTGPRKEVTPNMVVRAFSSLFHKGGQRDA